MAFQIIIDRRLHIYVEKHCGVGAFRMPLYCHSIILEESHWPCSLKYAGVLY